VEEEEIKWINCLAALLSLDGKKEGAAYFLKTD
jgi:hypothetical protein